MVPCKASGETADVGYQHREAIDSPNPWPGAKTGRRHSKHKSLRNCRVYRRSDQCRSVFQSVPHTLIIVIRFFSSGSKRTHGSLSYFVIDFYTTIIVVDA